MRLLRVTSLLLFIVLVTSLMTPVSMAQETIRVWGEAVVPALAVAQLPNGTTIGSVGEIKVRVLYPGEGRVYVNTEPLSDIDMQASVRAAVMIASYYARMNPLEYDFLVSIITDSPLIGGPSAGSALVAAIYSALTGISLKKTVASTGMILPDGLIGPVGGIPYKVQAAIESGYTTVLIPIGQSIYSETTYQTQTIGSVIVTRPVTVTWNVTDLAIKLGGRLVEASTAVDVIREFVGNIPLKQTYGTPSLTQEEFELTLTEYYGYTNQSLQLRVEVQSKLQNVSSRTIRNTIQNLLQSSENYYLQSNDMWKNGYYYTGLSFAFVSAYQAMMAKYLLEASLQSNPSTYLNNVLGNLSMQLNDYKHRYNDLLNKTYSYSLDNLFLLTEIHSRMRDAESTINSANQALQSGDISSASYYLGYAWGRIRSLGYWFNLLKLSYGKLMSEIQVEKLVSWILSYSYSSASYVDALQSTTGAQAYSTSKWYELLNVASSLITAKDYPGALDLAIEVLVSSSIALQSLFSLDVSRTSTILSEHSKLILGNSESPPISSRLYLMMGDSYASQSNYEASLSYYERALIILYASTMTIDQRSLDSSNTMTSTANTSQQQTVSSPLDISTKTTIPSASDTDTRTPETTSNSSVPKEATLYQQLVIILIVLITAVLLLRVVRRTA